MRVSIFWLILGSIYALSCAVAFGVQPQSRDLSSYHIIKSQPTENPKYKSGDQVESQFDALFNIANEASILVPAHYGSIAIIINGQKISQSPLRTHMHISRYHSLYEAKIPPSLLKQTGNTIQIQRLGSMRNMGLPDVYVGPTQKLQAFGNRQELLITWVDRMTLIIVILGMLVTAGLLFFSRKIAHYAYFFLMFALLLPQEFRAHITIMGQPLLDFMTYLGLSYLILSVLSFSHWTDGPIKERRIIIWVGAASLALVAVLDIVFGLDSIKTVPARASIFIAWGLGVVMWSANRLFRKSGAIPRTLIVIFAFASSFTLAFLIALITLFGSVDAMTRLFLVCLTNTVEALAFIGILATAAVYEASAYRRDLARNRTLSGIVSGRVLQLDDETQKLKSQIESKAVSEERQRFTRDIHDGIGGQLLSLLLKARSGTLTPDQAEAEVTASIADLRLITAALDASEDGLGVALASFGQRARDQLSVADMELIWHLDPRFHKIRLDPRAVLELLRWLQEGLTNAIRHSGGSHVSIDCRTSDDGKQITMRLADNGQGFHEPTCLAGRGLINMQERATRLGGDFAIGKEPVGTPFSTVMTLAIPIA